MATLLIVKHEGQPDNFTCTFSTFGELFISAGYWTILNGMFQIEKLNGGSLEQIYFEDITVRDDSSGSAGTPQTFSSESELRNRLLELGFLKQRGLSPQTFQEMYDTGLNTIVGLDGSEMVIDPGGLQIYNSTLGISTNVSPGDVSVNNGTYGYAISVLNETVRGVYFQSTTGTAVLRHDNSDSTGQRFLFKNIATDTEETLAIEP